MRRALIALTVVLAIGMTASAALAASPHFKKGGEPVCNVGSGTNSSSTTCSASLSGLGDGDLTINVTVSGSAVYQCQNGGGNTAPGQNRVLVGPTTTPTTIPGNQIKNGNVSFTTNPVCSRHHRPFPERKQGARTRTWTGVNPTLTTTNITMTIAQGGDTLFTCTASDPNGLSGTVPLSC